MLNINKLHLLLATEEMGWVVSHKMASLYILLDDDNITAPYHHCDIDHWEPTVNEVQAMMLIDRFDTYRIEKVLIEYEVRIYDTYATHPNKAMAICLAIAYFKNYEAHS